MRLWVLGAGLLTSLAAVADQNDGMLQEAADEVTAEEAERSPWRFTTELGIILRDGNTESRSWKGKINAQRDTEVWRHRAVLDYFRQERENIDGDTVTDDDRLFLSAQTNRVFREAEHSSLFLFGSYEDDRLSSYEYQTSVALGYGNRYNFSDDLFADFEIGPGYSYDKRRDTGETDGDFMLRLAANLEWDITETSRFTQQISTEIGDDNRRSRAVSALTANLNSRLAIRLSLTLTHNSTVFQQPDGRVPEKLDTETAVTLVYSF